MRKKKRKSPYKHKVRDHTRRAPKTKRPIRVRQYWRGDGAPPKPKPKLFKRSHQSQSTYLVKILYSNVSGETFTVQSTDYPTAIDQGLLLRRKMEMPMQVEAKRLG